MKRYLTLLFLLVLFAAGCSKSDAEQPPVKLPQLVTAVVETYDATTAVLGGSAGGVEAGELTQVGVQWIAWKAGTPGVPAWDAAMKRVADKTAMAWSIPIDGLTPATGYAVRAFASTSAGEYFGPVVNFTTDSEDVVPPVVATGEVTDFDAVSALLSGSVSSVELSRLSEVGVQVVIWGDQLTLQNLDWSQAVDYPARLEASWSVRATNLMPQRQYAARAYVGVEERRFFGEVVSFQTFAAGRKPLTVAQLRARHAASEDVSQERVRGYVALSIPHNLTTESFPAGTIILYDNTGAAGAALMLCAGVSDKGLGAAGLVVGDYVEVPLEGAVRKLEQGVIPCYENILSNQASLISRNHPIDPVWTTPAQLNAEAARYAGSPVKLSRVYAQRPGVLFSVADNGFTDGTDPVVVYAKAGSAVGQLTQNAATGTLCGICGYDGKVQVVPVTAADVASFTGDDPANTGDPAIVLLGTEYYEFAPQGGTLTVPCSVTRPENLRLFADTRYIDTDRYAIDIEGDRVSISARANTSGVTADYVNCYLYLAESKDVPRKATATLRITQLCSPYESIPGLIQANGGELSSVHAAVVNGFTTRAMKLGSGSYTGHFTSDAVNMSGTRRLVFYAVGWTEGKHEAGTLYLRVEGEGAVSTSAIPLRINAGASGQAPFELTVGSESRYEVTLTGLKPESTICFSTSPRFVRESDDKTGRALLLGVQLLD